MKPRLDREEHALLASLEDDSWESVPRLSAEKKRFQAIAKQTFNKTRRVNLRLSEKDFTDAHSKALEEGLPYQTLLSSIIHKYLSGRLVDSSKKVKVA